MRRLVSIAALGMAALFVLSGCKDKGGGTKGAEPVADPKTGKAADDLISRRDALMKSRQKLQEEREALDVERAKIIETGGDTSELDKKVEALVSQEQQISSQEGQLGDQMTALLEEVKSLQVGGGNAEVQVAARESGIANREKAVAGREDRVAQREAALAEREKTMAEKWKESCAVGGGTTTIVQTVDPKGTKYNKRDVEPVLKKAREAMSKKGILFSDLPSTVAGLEKEATKAMADGDFGPARFAAQQFLATVEATKVDRAFISGKISRLSATMKGKKLSDDDQKKVDALFRDATAAYGDGDYSAANKKLNQIYSII